MLSFDMPLDQLRTYQGANPRPADFDQYWDTALAEMRAVDPQIELVPVAMEANFAECFRLYFTGVGGARVHAQYLRPKHAAQPHPAVVMFHGYSGNSGDFQDKLGLVAQGYTVAALDVRGQGGLSEDVGGIKGRTFSGQFIRGLADTPEKMLYRQIYLDCAQLAGIVMNLPEVDRARVYAAGASQGGALTLACAALEPRIARAASWYPFLCDFKRVYDMELAVHAYSELKDYFRFYDPLHERENEIFTRLGYIDIQHLAPRIRAEVLLITCLADTICPPSSQFAAYNKITSPKNMLLYPDYGHEDPTGARDKVFNFLARE